MPSNPFISFAQDPVGFLSAIAYVLILIGILIVGVPHAVRTLIEVYTDWQQNKSRDKWQRLYGDGPGYIPPFTVALKAMWAFFVSAAAFWAVSALLWAVGV